MTQAPSQCLLLVGAGHANIAVIKRLVKNPDPSVRLIVVHPQGDALYSGLLPAVLAGDLTPDALSIDVQALTERAGGWFIRGEITQVDPQGSRIFLKRPDWLGGESLPSLTFDHLILNTGAEPGVPFPSTHPALYPVKPLTRFVQQLPEIDHLLSQQNSASLSIVGGGPAGLELAFAARRRYGPDLPITLIGKRTLAEDPALRAGRGAIERALRRHHIQWHPKTEIIKATDGQLRSADGRTFPASMVWVATPVQPPKWLSTSDLTRCPDGFLQVNDTLQCLGQSAIYAVGDLATLASPRARSGVMAVRGGQYLATHITRLLQSQPIPAFRPQPRWLTLLNTGDRRAIAIRGHWSAEGAWVFRWKQWIDQRFMARFQMHPMQESSMHCEGCAAKLPGDVLQHTLPGHSAQDASYLAIGEESVALSVDALTHCLSDPALMGCLAVRHAASDLYAGGGQTGALVNCIGVQRSDRRELMLTEFQWVLHGITREAARLGLQMAGGHTLSLEQPMVGVSLVGPVRRRVDKTQVHPGDVFWITGPIGTGLFFAGIRQGLISGRQVDRFLARWNQAPSVQQAATIALDFGATAMTDVTGFGLAGHLSEMLGDQAPLFEPYAAPVLYPEIVTLDQDGLQSSAAPDNWRYTHPSLRAHASWAWYDPQTGGPLLIAIPEHRSDALGEALRMAGFEPQCLGHLVDPTS